LPQISRDLPETSTKGRLRGVEASLPQQGPVGRTRRRKLPQVSPDLPLIVSVQKHAPRFLGSGGALQVASTQTASEPHLRSPCGRTSALVGAKNGYAPCATQTVRRRASFPLVPRKTIAQVSHRDVSRSSAFQASRGHPRCCIALTRTQAGLFRRARFQCSAAVGDGMIEQFEHEAKGC
jgi:hypothetical protein